MPPLHRSYGSENLAESWRSACFKAMGLEDWEVVDSNNNNNYGENETSAPTSAADAAAFQVINLLEWENVENEEEDGDGDDDNNRDPWMETAVQIQLNIQKMAAWIRQKQDEYIQLNIAEGEASLIQSTIASFTATTASEIESLHQCVTTGGSSSSANTQKQQHCAGIVQILMMQLKEEIAEPFGQLSQYRNRMAVPIWQKPLQCRLWTGGGHKNNNKNKIGSSSKTTTSKGKKDATLELLGFDDDDEDDDDAEDRRNRTDQRFQATRPSHRLHRDFLKSYDRGLGTVQQQQGPPPFLFPIYNTDDNDEQQQHVSFTKHEERRRKDHAKPQTKKKSSRDEKFNSFDNDIARENDIASATASALQQESILLQAKTHSDLDSVQKMEQTMMDITTLLSQFANLVSEQQEDVWEIHDATVSTKKNLEQGQENLQDAKQRTKASRHYMATAITTMGIILLLLNWLRS